MVYLKTWEEFSKAVENVYFADPLNVNILLKYLISNLKASISSLQLKCRFVTKYRNNKGLSLKVTNDRVVST
jgi:hypothetical protein